MVTPDTLLFPTLVNSHTHLAMGALRGITDGDAFTGNVVEDLFFRLEVALEPEDVRAFVRMGCWEALLAGTGSVWEHYYFGDAIADAFMVFIFEKKNPKLWLIFSPKNMSGCYYNFSMR